MSLSFVLVVCWAVWPGCAAQGSGDCSSDDRLGKIEVLLQGHTVQANQLVTHLADLAEKLGVRIWSIQPFQA